MAALSRGTALKLGGGEAHPAAVDGATGELRSDLRLIAEMIDLGARVTYCDRAEVTFMLPLGRLHVDKDIYWVYQLSSWRDELYGIARVSDDAVRTD